jgi:hypothetical protein
MAGKLNDRFTCHSRESWNPKEKDWMPAFAGVTKNKTK